MANPFAVFCCMQNSSAPSPPFVSIIIPTWNEASVLAATLASTDCLFVTKEVVVVDGGSTDDTVKIAQDAGVRTIISPVKQRAAQMNLGAQEASGEILLFLHADTHLRPSSLLKLRDALQDPAVVGGAFARVYDSESLFLKFTCRLAQVRNRALSWYFGDQGIFVRRNVFEAMRGYLHVDMFEDFDFCRRLKSKGKLVMVQPPIISSARRFEARGPLQTTIDDLQQTWIYVMYGLPPFPRSASPLNYPEKDRPIP